MGLPQLHQCCHTTTIFLTDDDLRKLEKQQWQDHPEMRHVRTVTSRHFWGGRKILAKKRGGSCVFLTASGRCRIHELYGAEAKPAVCQLFPLQIVPMECSAWVTLRRSCPSAAADRGRPLQQHVPQLRKSPLLAGFALPAAEPVAIVRGTRRSWPEFRATANVLTRLLTDSNLPLVRRIVHGLRFCDLLSQCKLKNVEDGSWDELMQLLLGAAPEGAGELFRDRQPPSRGSDALLRQIGTHYISSFPGFPTGQGWKEQWRMLWTAFQFSRGKGTVPLTHPTFPVQTFEDLQRPLGPLSEEITRPLARLFETQATSLQFTLLMARQPLVTSFRTLALNYPLAMWLLRLSVGTRTPQSDDMVNIVVALQRGEGLPAMARAAKEMANNGQLVRLVAWYAR